MLNELETVHVSNSKNLVFKSDWPSQIAIQSMRTDLKRKMDKMSSVSVNKYKDARVELVISAETLQTDS